MVASTYETTPEFAAIPRHEAVAFADSGMLVAVTGQIGDPEAQRLAKLFAGAQSLADALDPEVLEAIAVEIGSDFHHSARADSLRVLARKQRSAMYVAGVLP